MTAVVLLAAPASGEIGLGHVARLCALGVGLRAASASTLFATSSEDARVHAFIERSGAALQAVTPLDGAALLQAARACGATHVAIDSYATAGADVQALTGAGLDVLYVDDMALAPSRDAGVIVNPNFFGVEVRYQTRPLARVLAGPEYALLRPEFAVARAATATPRTGPLRVLVTLGGADPLGLLPRIVDALGQVEPELSVDIVVGAADPKVDAARAAAAKLSGATVTVAAADMAARIARADAVITAAGSTCLEIACIGRPALAIPVSASQVPVGAFLERGGLMSVISGTASVPDLVRAIRSLFGGAFSPESSARISSQRRLVDGGGASRVAVSWLGRGLGRSR